MLTQHIYTQSNHMFIVYVTMASLGDEVGGVSVCGLQDLGELFV